VSHTEAIDAHAHVVPLSLLEQLPQARRTDRGWVVSMPGTGDTRPIGARMIEAGPRRAWLAEKGVARQILSPWMDIQSDGTRDWVQRLNEAMYASAAELGTVTLTSVDTTDGDQAAADLEKAWAQPEVAGLILSTNPAGGPALHEPALAPLWTVAAERGIPVVLHPPTCGPSGALPTLGSMGNVHGRLVDNTLAITELILHGLLDRHPELKVLLVHGGGFLPYQAARLDGGYRTKESHAGDLERGKPSAYLSEFYYDTVALSAPAIEFLVSVAGRERVLLGSDYPFALGDPEPVRTVEQTGLDSLTVRAILHDNATKLFGRNA
jgi:aminocarboxymuconate-semialdehyde decarboxylase